MHQPIDDLRLEMELFGVRDVLPGTPATRTEPGRGPGTEMPARRPDAMRRRPQHFDQRSCRATSLRPSDVDANAFPRYGEWDADASRPERRDAVAARVQRLDRP